MTTVPEITRLIARIEDWKGQGPALGRAEAARRLDEAHKLLDEIANMLADVRRELLGKRWSARPHKGGLRPTGAQKEGRNQHGAALKVILSAAGTTDRRAILRAAGAKDYLGSNVRPGGRRLACRHSIKRAPFRQRGAVRQYSFAGRRAP